VVHGQLRGHVRAERRSPTAAADRNDVELRDAEGRCNAADGTGRAARGSRDSRPPQLRLIGGRHARTCDCALSACKNTTSGKQPDQLEAPEASTSASTREDASHRWRRRRRRGGDRDWSISVSIEGGVRQRESSGHVPARRICPCSRRLVTSHSRAVGHATTRSTARIDRRDGGRASSSSSRRRTRHRLFGADFASFGDEVGTGTMEDDYGTWEVSYKKAVFQTDDGAVEADPGRAVRRDDRRGRLAHRGARELEVTKTPDTLPGCGGGIGTTAQLRDARRRDAAPARRSRATRGRASVRPLQLRRVITRPIKRSTTRSLPGVGVICTGGLFARFSPGWRNACSVHGSFTTSM
jgi:hypothetical protein